jgi:SAM-dependent methyltransferase
MSVEAARFFVKMPRTSTQTRPVAASPRLPEVTGNGGEIRVRQLLDVASIDDLNRRAEEYFASLPDWDHHLVKPFSTPDEAATLLIKVGTLLQGLNLFSGATVLDFGGGTGWLSRILTQFGCHVIVLDVSPTALRMARELYERLPIVGSTAPPFTSRLTSSNNC